MTKDQDSDSPEMAPPAGGPGPDEDAGNKAQKSSQDQAAGASPEAPDAPPAEQPAAAEANDVPPADGGTNNELDEDPAGMMTLLEDARAKADENWNLLLRARAELENLRRRQAAELEKAHKFALDGFVRELLQVRDSLELGQAAARDEAADVAKLREGTELTLKLLADVMAKFGVEPIDPEGEPFNPDYHQAMSLQPREDVPPSTVVTVIQKGYVLNGRLVRPALVMVSQQPAE